MVLCVSGIVEVTRNYQVTIPAVVRDKLGIKEGDLVRVVYDESERVAKIIPIKKRRITVRLGRKISVEEIEELIEETLNEVTS